MSLALDSYYTHELERLWLSPATPDDDKALIHEELQRRDTGEHHEPISPAEGEAEEKQ